MSDLGLWALGLRSRVAVAVPATSARRSRGGRTWGTVAIVLAALLTACSGAAPEPAASGAANATEASQFSEPVASPSEAATDPATVLGPGWVTDRDDDLVPDALEVAVGTDPDVDACAEEPQCGDGSGAGPDPLDAAEGGANTLLILDASGSMVGEAGGADTKMEVAKEAVVRYVVGLPEFVDAGLMVYGHVGSNDERDKAASCARVETFADLGELTYETVDEAVDAFRPVGWTPIAGALEAARGQFAGHDDADNRVILVSDGIETCDGDPVAAARALADADVDVDVTIDVVGVDVDADAARQLKEVASVTGGEYTDARSAASVRSYFDEQRQLVFELDRRWRCYAVYRNRVTYCYNLARRDAVDRYLADLLRETDDPLRQAALRTVVSTISDDTRARVGGLTDTAQARMEPLRDQLRVARERWLRRYRESAAVTATLACNTAWNPLVGLGTAVTV